jgi:hypothetical protein
VYVNICMPVPVPVPVPDHGLYLQRLRREENKVRTLQGELTSERERRQRLLEMGRRRGVHAGPSAAHARSPGRQQGGVGGRTRHGVTVDHQLGHHQLPGTEGVSARGQGLPHEQAHVPPVVMSEITALEQLQSTVDDDSAVHSTNVSGPLLSVSNVTTAKLSHHRARFHIPPAKQPTSRISDADGCHALPVRTMVPCASM